MKLSVKSIEISEGQQQPVRCSFATEANPIIKYLRMNTFNWKLSHIKMKNVSYQ